VTSISIIDFEARNVFAPSVAEAKGSTLTHTFDGFMSFAYWLFHDGSQETVEVTVTCGTVKGGAGTADSAPVKATAEPADIVVSGEQVTDGRNSFVLPEGWTLFKSNNPSENIHLFEVDGELSGFAIFYPTESEGVSPKIFRSNTLESDLVELASGIYLTLLEADVQITDVQPLPFAPDSGFYLEGTAGSQTAAAALLRFSDTEAVIIVMLTQNDTLVADTLAFIQSVRIGENTSLPTHEVDLEPRIVFVTTENEIATVSTDGDDLQILTPAEEIDVVDYQRPRFSPDGSQIVYLLTTKTGTYSRTYNYYVISREGSEPELVYECGLYACTGASWSPDGTRIALTQSDAMSMLNIQIVTVETGNVQTITPTFFGFSYTQPEWSPDGTTIAFSYINGGVESLGLADVGAGTARETGVGDESGLFNSGIRWSDDGSQVIIGGSHGYLVIPRQGKTHQYIEPDFKATGIVDRFYTDGSIRFLSTQNDTILFSRYAADGALLEDVSIETALSYRGANWQPDGAIELAFSDDEAGSGGEVQCRVSVLRRANVRTGPGTDYEIDRPIKGGANRSVVGQAADSDGYTWWHLKAGGWVREDVVRELDAGCATLQVETP